MKRLLPSRCWVPLMVMAVLYAAANSLSATAAPKGCLIYSDSANYTEACEYSTLRIGPVYASVQRVDGHNFQLITTGPITPVEYPSDNPRLVTEEDAEWNLQTIRQLQQRYPQLQKWLAAIASRWRNALAFAKQAANRSLPEGSYDGDALVSVNLPHYAGMPPNALGAMAAQAASKVILDQSTQTAVRPDRFARFGGTSLDKRPGFIGSGGSLLAKSSLLRSTKTSETASSDTEPATA